MPINRKPLVMGLVAFITVIVATVGYSMYSTAVREKAEATERASLAVAAKLALEQAEARQREEAQRQAEATQKEKLAKELAAAKAELERANLKNQQLSAQAITDSRAEKAPKLRPNAKTGTAGPVNSSTTSDQGKSNTVLPPAPVQQVQAPPLPTQAAAVVGAAASPKEACGSRNFIAMAICVGQKCRAPEYFNHQQCVEHRAFEKQNLEKRAEDRR